MDAYDNLKKRLFTNDIRTLEKLLKEHKNKLKSDIVKNNKKEIEKDLNHLEIVNRCIEPFQETGSAYKKTGYLFIRVEPLYEFGVKNFDILLFNKNTKIAVLIECKYTITRPKKEVDTIIKASKVAEDNKEKLSQIVRSDIDNMEFIIATPPEYYSDVKKAILKKNNNLKHWSVLPYERLIKTKGEWDIEHLHADHVLKDQLSQGIKAHKGKIIGFLPSSHGCLILQNICSRLWNILRKRKEKTFSLTDINTIIKQESQQFLNFRPDEIVRLVRNMVDLGEKVGVFENLTPTKEFRDREYTLKIGFIHDIEERVKEKYDDFKISEREEEIDEHAKDVACKEFKRKYWKQKSLNNLN